MLALLLADEASAASGAFQPDAVHAILGALLTLAVGKIGLDWAKIKRFATALRVVADVVNRVADEQLHPSQAKDAIRSRSEAAGTESVLKPIVQSLEPVAPSPGPSRNGVASALLLALALGASGCVSREVHETAVRAKATATTVREKASKFRRIVVPASTEGRAVAATVALGDELEAALADLELAIGKVEEASR